MLITTFFFFCFFFSLYKFCSCYGLIVVHIKSILWISMHKVENIGISELSQLATC